LRLESRFREGQALSVLFPPHLNKRTTSIVKKLMSIPGNDGAENMKLKVVLEPSDEGGFTVYVPSLPGCITEGDTREEALANIREAIDLYLVEEDPMVLPEKAQLVELVV